MLWSELSGSCPKRWRASNKPAENFMDTTASPQIVEDNDANYYQPFFRR